MALIFIKNYLGENIMYINKKIKYSRRMFCIKVTNNTESGAVLLTTLIILVLLTIIGISAVNITTTDLQISSNNKIYQKNLYLAESAANEAIQHIYQVLLGKEQSKKWIQDIAKYNSKDQLNWSESYRNSSMNSRLSNYHAKYKAFSNKTGNANKYKVFGLGQYKGRAVVEIQLNVNSTQNILNTKSALGVYTSNSSINGTGNGGIYGINYNLPADFDCSGSGCDGTQNPTVNGTYALYMEYTSSKFNQSGNFDLKSDLDLFGKNTGNNNASNSDRWISLANYLKSSSEVVNYKDDDSLGNRKNPMVTVIGNDTNLSGSDDGAGILIIENNTEFNVSGNFHFEGLVIKIDYEDNSKDDAFLSGTNDIFGTVIIAGSGTTEVFNAGNANIKYSKRALINVLEKIDALDLIEIDYWREVSF